MSGYALGATPRVHCGAGARSELVSLVPAGTTEILLVTDGGIESAGIAQRVRDVLPETARVETAYAPSHEPTVADIDRVADQARGLVAPVVIAVGGGTVLDMAKLVAALQPLGESVHAYLLSAGSFSTRLPSLMVPTTSGTGSEGTRTCIVTDSHDRKCWIFGDVLLPDGIVLDPELTTGLPAHLTLATGIDAFVHAFEAASAQAANAVSRAQGLHAIRLTRTHLGNAVADGTDLTARRGMQEAAMLAGFAIDSAGTGMAHNIGHALGSLYHIPHGVAVAVGLDASIDWTVSAPSQVFDDIALAMDATARADHLPALYRTWLAHLGSDWIERGLGHGRFEAGRLADAMRAPENAPMAANNTRQPNDNDVAALADATLTSADAHRSSRFQAAT